MLIYRLTTKIIYVNMQNESRYVGTELKREKGPSLQKVCRYRVKEGQRS